jgi:phytoene desaturase
MPKTISIIWWWIWWLATAVLLAKSGHKVSVYEKNECRWGRAGMFEANGYRFDMGPSWYLMPDLFEEYFEMIWENIHDHLDLKQLSPSYKVFRKQPQDTKWNMCNLEVYSDIDRMAEQFEFIESWAGNKFKTFLQQSWRQYPIWMEFAKRNYDSIFDFFDRNFAWKGIKLNIRTTIDNYVARFFKTSIIQKIMQYTTVFLGTAPNKTPAFYNIMSHVDFAMGVWYPQGWLHEIAEVLVNIGKKHGVGYFLEHELVEVSSNKKQVTGVKFKNWKQVQSDHYIINTDQARFETTILSSTDQTYSQDFWKKKTFAPSGFIIYAGVNKKLANFEHHNLYFNEDRNKSFGDIFDRKLLPEDPSLYVCAPSKTDPHVAPEWKENLFFLVPIPNGIEISPEQKSSYREKVWKIVEQMAGEEILPYVQYEQIFEVDDFKQRYNARNGTALGLAHTMMQTACFRPNNYSKKLDNLFYVGHNTNPGIWIPMVIMSAILVTQRMQQKGVL